MATVNKIIAIRTHEGGKAKHITPEQQLKRSMMSCMLWEKEFYEDGEKIAKRIETLAAGVDPLICKDIAIKARTDMKLRHATLLLTRAMARLPKHKEHVANTMFKVINRADELTEFLAIYWKDGREKLSSQVKKGLAKAFVKFSEYDLQKWNKDGEVKLKDVLFLSHAKPNNQEQAEMWKRLINDELKTPDTWETNLSAGKDKKETFERLLKEKKIGALAVLRNLRNMTKVGVDEDLLKKYISNMDVSKVLPFRFIAASRYVPSLESDLEYCFFACLKNKKKLTGKTVLLVDVSGSMDGSLSEKSDMTRMDAACGLAMAAREVCDNVEVYTFSNDIIEVPNRRGFALRGAVINSQDHSGTDLGNAIKILNDKKFNRLIVITDEQSHTNVCDPKCEKPYVINVSSARNGIGYGKWTHFDGFSEAIIDYIIEYEKE